MEDLPIYEEIIRLKKNREPAVVATVVETEGSTPRKAGAKMIIRKDGTISGTVGGGGTEADVIEAAGEVIRSGTPRTMRFSLTEEHGGVCGGNLLIYLEPLMAPDHLIVVGDGHVGRAVRQSAKPAGFMVSMIGLSQTETNNGSREGAIHYPLNKLAEAFKEIGADASTYIFIATSDHHQDFEAVREALATEARYIAVIGSRKKKVAMAKFLLGKGLDEKAIDRIFSPAGLEIGAETPAEIGISVVAEMIKVRRHSVAAGDSQSARDGKIQKDLVQRTIVAHG